MLLYRAGTAHVEVMAAHDIPLAIAGDVDFELPDRLELEPGDMMVLITDGFFEWRNPQSEQFGIERLTRAIERLAHQPSERIITELAREVREFGNGTPQDDDLTAVVIKRIRPAGQVRATPDRKNA